MISPARVITTSEWESGMTCKERTSGSRLDGAGPFFEVPADHGFVASMVGVLKLVTEDNASY